MIKLEKTTSRYVALSIMAIIVGVSVFTVWKAYSDYIDEKQHVVKRLSKIKRKLEYISGNKKEIKTMYSAYKNNRSMGELFFSKKNAEKELEALISRINKTSCNLVRQDMGKVKEDDGDIRVKYKTKCPYTDIYNLMVLIDNARPLIFIEEIDISRSNNNAVNSMNIEFAIKGYAKG